ncbi:MAG: FAD-binding protein [Ilumatobacter sp.]|jgi:FAD/FMN-containing dehydrogenase|uniref:FAD-binding protein n=1 Tax=Ilumatobacter sp. TaxID=1967498 RepID=UPI00391A88AC
MDLTLDAFAESVGVDDPVTIEGSSSRGGAVAEARVVRAPSGIIRIDPAEMVVECGAGTLMVELAAALSEHGQTVSIPASGTVGGALAMGHSDITRLGHGAIRDVLLRTHYVSSTGTLTTAGGSTVKNVSGFDLCRLLVGARGTLGFFGDVLLRTRPLPTFSAWFASGRDPVELLGGIFRPVSLLWDGGTSWIRLDGHPADVERTATVWDLREVDGPPPLPSGSRWSMAPHMIVDQLADATDSFVAEMGVGIVHRAGPPAQRWVSPTVADLHVRIKRQFDPSGRLNPGVAPDRDG